MADKQISVRISAQGGQELKAQLVDIGNEGARSFTKLGGATKSMTPQIQNAAFQIGDFAVQVGGGTSATRALAQQLPQLLGGFGVFGAVVGAAVAVLVPLTSALLGAGEASKTVDEALGDLTKSVSDFAKAAEASLAPIGELAETYGRFGTAAQTALAAITDATREQSIRNLEAAARSLGDALGNTTGAQMRTLRKEMGLTDDVAGQLWLGFAHLGQAEGPVKIAAEAAELQSAMLAAFGSAEAMNDEALKLYVSLGEMVTQGNLLNATIEETNIAMSAMPGLITAAAGSWSGLLGAAQAYLAKVQAAQAAQAFMAGQVAAFMGDDERGSQRAVNRDTAEYLTRNGSYAEREKGGGGNDAAREAERIFNDTRTAAENYQIELQDLNELLSTGYLDAEIYARAIKMIEEEYLGAGDAAKFWQDASKTLKDGLIDAIVDGKSLTDVFQNLAKSIAKAALQAALFGEGPFAKAGGGGGLLGGLFAKIFAPTSHAGGLVGAAGSAKAVSPLAFLGARRFHNGGWPGLAPDEVPTILQTGERVLSRREVAEGGIGGGSAVVVNNYSGQPASAEKTRGPDGRELITVIVGEQMARGKFDKQQGGRFGQKPQRVMR